MIVHFDGTIDEVCAEMARFLTCMGYSGRPTPPEPTYSDPPMADRDMTSPAIGAPNKKAKKAKAPVEHEYEEVERVYEVPIPDIPIKEEATVDDKARAAVDLLKLKNEQLDRLRELFNAGKGPFVRELLSKYGEGAKVFPEVDAKHFPQIKADIDRELN